MNFTCDDDTLIANSNFTEDIENFFFENFRYDKEEVRKSICDEIRIQNFVRKLEQFYLKSLHIDDIDESIFVREHSILTPMKFTPFNSQANANFHYRKLSPVIETLNHQNSFTENNNLNTITINSKLCDTVEFPKLSHLGLSPSSFANKNPKNNISNSQYLYLCV